MSFASPAYLFALPVVALVSWLLRGRVRLQNLFLLAFSLFFYGYWDWRFLGLLLASVGIDYGMGLWIASAPEGAPRRRRLVPAVVLNLGVLGVFKYHDFFAGSLSAVLGIPLPVLRLVLPVGISFYTFQSLSYLLDVAAGKLAPVRSLPDYALFVTFFPQLVAGPIERATSLVPQLARGKSPTRSQLREGAYLVLYGLFQKVAVGDSAGSVAEYAFGHGAGGWIAVLTGVLAFSLQIYGDFAGYSNIARGSAKLLGVELLVNFRTPYFAASFGEFWRRWHVSLSQFLRDYLYIPLGGSRGGTARTCANLMLVMLLGGLWHGANWTFVVWGGIHGLCLCAGRLLPAEGAVPAWLRRLGVFSVVSLAWVFFRSPTLDEAVRHLGTLFTLGAGSWSPDLLLKLAAAALFLLPLDALSFRKGDDLSPLSWPWWARGSLYAFLAWSVYGGIGGRHPFIYFQF